MSKSTGPEPVVTEERLHTFARMSARAQAIPRLVYGVIGGRSGTQRHRRATRWPWR